MKTLTRIAASGLVWISLPLGAVAQDAKTPPDPAPKDQPAQTAPQPPAPAQPAPAPAPVGDPSLTVATVRMDGGLRASKVIGSAVTGADNQQIGTVSDLIMDKDNKVVMGVISVGSVLGLGGKLIAVPIASLKIDASGKVAYPEGSKDSVGKMPGFTYTQ